MKWVVSGVTSGYDTIVYAGVGRWCVPWCVSCGDKRVRKWVVILLFIHFGFY